MNQYLKALDNQRPLCFFDSFWECILEKQGLISKEPGETMGTRETLHPQNTGKNSKALSKGCLSDTYHFGGQWKAGRAALLCRSKGDTLPPLRKEAFLSHRDHVHPGTLPVTKHNWHVLEIEIRTQNNNNKSPAAALTSYVLIAQVINNILLLPLYKTAISVIDDWMWLPPTSYQGAPCLQSHTVCDASCAWGPAPCSGFRVPPSTYVNR